MEDLASSAAVQGVLYGHRASLKLRKFAGGTAMDRDDERFQKQIERCIGELRSDIENPENCDAIGVGVVRDLRQVIDDIEAQFRATTEPRIKTVTD